MHLILACIKFLFRSTNEHGVHSPFVFSLVRKCFYDKKKYPAYELIRKYRKKLLSNHNSIKVTDFGAGSRVFSSEERKISAIAKNAGIFPKRARLLNRLVRYLKVENALELGTSIGIGTAAMAAGNKVRVTTIEGCPQTAAVAREQFEEFGVNNIELLVGEFEEAIDKKVDRGQRTESRRNSVGADLQSVTGTPVQDSQPTTENRQLTTDKKNSKSQIPDSNNPQSTTENRQPTTHNRKPRTAKKTSYDLIFIDGNHRKEPTLSYFEKLLPLVHNDSVMILDDIHWSKEMEEAWEEIKKHPSVKVTIDTFFQGFVFFRREQVKEHFVIRV